MKKTKLKICGLMRTQDVLCCAENGVDIAGFVTEYPAFVPWNLTENQAAELMSAVKEPMKTCIVTGGGAEKITSLARRLRPDFVQLHYHETISDTRRIVRELSLQGTGVIKTLPMEAKERAYQFGTTDAAECVKMLNDSGVYSILLDSRGPSGTFTAVPDSFKDIVTAVRRNTSFPFIMAGGINAENAAEICEKFCPDMLDVMTGVEISYGVKSPQKIAELAKCLTNFLV